MSSSRTIQDTSSRLRNDYQYKINILQKQIDNLKTQIKFLKNPSNDPSNGTILTFNNIPINTNTNSDEYIIKPQTVEDEANKYSMTITIVDNANTQNSNAIILDLKITDTTNNNNIIDVNYISTTINISTNNYEGYISTGPINNANKNNNNQITNFTLLLLFLSSCNTTTISITIKLI